MYLKKRNVKLIALCAVMLFAATVLFMIYYRYSILLTSQRAAETFKGESEGQFSQASAFLPVGEETDEEGIYNMTVSLESKLLDASLTATGRQSLYDYAYCSEGTITVTGDRMTAEVSAVGVGGDFFLFHPYFLRSGSYISESDITHDAVVLDEELAWMLFGGVELAGMTVTIDNEPYYVAGVIHREDDFASEKAYTDGAGIFMAYDKFLAVTGNGISAVEIVCANPIDGFVSSALADIFNNAVIVENTGRFSISGIIDVLKETGERSMRREAVSFPYWENAARYIEDILSRILPAAIILVTIPAIIGAAAFIKAARRCWRLAKIMVPMLLEEYSERRYRERGEEADGGSRFQ